MNRLENVFHFLFGGVVVVLQGSKVGEFSAAAPKFAGSYRDYSAKKQTNQASVRMINYDLIQYYLGDLYCFSCTHAPPPLSTFCSDLRIGSSLYPTDWAR